MNRQQRREYNKKHHTNYTREDFDIAITLARLRNGDKGIEQAELSKMASIYNFVHLDNQKIAPNGCEVMLNYEGILTRPKTELTEMFLSWVEDNKDKIFHLTREGSKQSLVCLEEDQREVEIDGQKQMAERWLFDLYSDILVKDKDGEFKKPGDIEIEEE